MLRRIAIISEHASPLSALGGVDSGGQNVYVAQVGRRLAAMGHEVDVFVRRDSPALPAVCEQGCGLRVVHVDAGPSQFVAKEDMLPLMGPFTDWISRFIRSEGPYDVIHANFFMSGLAAAELKRRHGIPYVVTFHALGRVRLLHQGSADRFPPQRPDIEKHVMDEADAIVAECPQDRQDQEVLYGADPERIHVVPCGFDGKELWPVGCAEARWFLNLDPRERLVLHVGRMVPRKGIDTAIEGFARLVHKHGIAARMVIVGGESESPDPRLTPEIGRLQEVARQQQVSERVTFTGRRGRQALRDYYSAADVFVTTPWYEPFGITPVEAMACGTPVVGSDVGGIKYTVSPGHTGFLVPPRDPDAVAGCLARVCSSPGLRDRLGTAAIIRANRLFTWERVTHQIAALYEKVLAGAERDARTFGRAAAMRRPPAGRDGRARANGAVHGLRRLLPLLDEYRQKRLRIVLTSGCFDILHRGHADCLAAARRLGDVLVVGVNDDDSIRRLKGPGRPINKLADRMGLLAALAGVDHVVAFGEDTPHRLIEAVRPDVFVKGGDYTRATLPEAELVERLGGTVEIIPFAFDRSTTRIIEHVCRAYGPQPEGAGPQEENNHDQWELAVCPPAAVH